MRPMTGKSAGRMSVMLIAAMLLPIMAPICATAGKGTVEPIVISSFTDRAGSININAGKGEGIVVGAKGAIIREGKVIAEYTVQQVNWGLSTIALSNPVSGYTVRVGDSAPITGTPTTPTKGDTPKKKSSSRSKLIWAAAAAGVLAIYFLARGHHSGSSLSGYTLTLDAAKTTTYADTATSVITITATMRDANGNPVPDGTPVTFASSAGTLNHSQATTNQGKVTVSVTGTAADGTATVTVRAADKSATINVSFVASIDLVASPTSIQTTNSGGAQTQSTITATCRDAHGVLATDGTIKFSTSVGTVAPDSATVVNGIAQTTLTSAAAGTATIEATWSGTSATTPVTITSGPPYAVSVASNTNSIQCDGNSYATITATVTDVAGNTVADGTVVRFAVTPDANGGGNGSITSQLSTTTGVAKAFLFSKDAAGAKSKSGTASVTVQVLVADQPSTVPAPATDIVNSATKVQFTSIDVAEIHISATPTNVRGWDVANNKSTVTAVVYNTDHAPVPDGTVVTFKATHGLISGTGTTAAGVATTSLVTDASGNATWNGLVDVTATAGGVSVTQPGLVVFSGWPSPSHCQATISQATLAKSSGQATIYVEAKDTNGNPIVDDTTVTVSTSKGTVAPTSAKTSNGVVMFTLTTSTDVANPTDPGAGKVTITVPSGGSNPETGGLPVTLTVDFTVSP